MPITDYNKKKQLSATSFNDSNASISKAQPIALVGNDYTGVDGFESGSSQLGWESDGNITIDNNAEIYLNNSLKVSSSNFDVVEIEGLSSEVTTDGKRLSGSVKIDSQTGNSSDEVAIEGVDGTGSIEIGLSFLGDGNVEDVNNSVIDSWSAGTIIDFELVLDFSNNQYDIVIDDSTVASNIAFAASASTIVSLQLINSTTASGSTVNAFFDRLTYTSNAEDTINSGGYIGIDDSNVAGKSDIAVYDANGNLIPYEIENEGDITASGLSDVVWIWTFPSVVGNWVRDGSTQAQVAYGDNSANTDRQNVTGTYTAEYEAVYHMNQSSIIDSTSNNRDATGVTGTTTLNTPLATGLQFDGTDDFITIPNNFGVFDGTQSFTLRFYIRPEQSGASEEFFSTQGERDIRIDFDSNDTFDYQSFNGSTVTRVNSSVKSIDDYYVAELKFDASTDTVEWYINGQVDTSETSNIAPATKSEDNTIGKRIQSGQEFFGEITEVEILSEHVTDSSSQAFYDATPEGGQVFFTQQAAQPTISDQTITVPETQLKQTNPDPAIQGGAVTVSTPKTSLTAATPAPAVTPGTSTINTPANSLTAATPAPTLTPGDTTLQVQPTKLTVLQDNPELNAVFTIQTPANSLTVNNPAPNLEIGQTIITPANILTAENPEPALNAGPTSIDVGRNTLTINNPVPQFNRQVVLGFPTKLEANNPEPQVEPGPTTIDTPKTVLTVTNPVPDFVPGNTDITFNATRIQARNPEPVLTPGPTTIQSQPTELTVSTPEASLGFDLQFVSPTKAVITNNVRYFDMADHTFTQNDFGDTLTATLKDDENPDGVDLSGSTEVRLTAKNRKGEKVIDKEMSVATAAAGDVEYFWDQNDFITDPGIYRAKIKVFDSTGEAESFPNDGFRTIEIEEEID